MSEPDDDPVNEAPPEELALPLTEFDDDALTVEEALPATDRELVIEGDPETESVFEADSEGLNDNNPVVVVVVETDNEDKEEDDKLDEILGLTEELEDALSCTEYDCLPLTVTTTLTVGAVD